MNYRKNINKNNNLIELTECKKKLSDNNTLIAKGKYGTIYKIESIKCGSVILKTFHKKINEKEIYRELNILDRVRSIIDNNICPHFLYYYDFFKIDNNINILIEYADGDLEKWAKTKHTDKEWKVLIFQFLTGVYVIQKYLKGFHSNLCPKNIFYINTQKTNKYYEYLIDTEKYYIPDINCLFLLADYSNFQSLFLDDNTLTETDINNAMRENQDFNYLQIFNKKIMINNLIKKYNLENLKKKFGNNNKFQDYCFKNQKLDIIKILDFCITENIIDYEEEVINNLNQEQYPASKKIRNFINTILTNYSDINLIIDKHFKEFKKKQDNIIQSFNLNKT